MASTSTIREAIANADAQLNNVGVPTYSELFARFMLVDSFAARCEKYEGTYCQRAAQKMIDRIERVM